LNGDYLHGTPELDNVVARMRASGGREAANQSAGIQEQFARNGVQFSTANQQAQQSAGAAATAKSNDTEAGLRYQNYQNERNNQLSAVGLLDAAQQAPLNYLDKASTAGLAPMSQMGQIIAGLAGNGQLVKPDIMPQKSIGGSMLDLVGNL